MLASAGRRAIVRASAAHFTRSSQHAVMLTTRRAMSDSAPTKAYPDPMPARAVPASDAGASFSDSSSPSVPPPPFRKSNLDPPGWVMWMGRLAGVAFGVAVAVQLVTFVKRKQHASEQAAQERTEASNGPAPGAPSVPMMDYRAHSMSAIFQSVLAPLEEFDRRADDFVERKAVSEARVAEVARRRKLGPVDAKHAKETEVMATRIAAEERTLFAPRLEYLRELYRVRSLELMQRSQFNGERLVATRSGGGDKTAPEPSGEDQATVKAEVLAEQAAFQKLAQANQHLSAIAAKYGLRGPSSAARAMQPTTEGGAAQQE